MGGEGTGVKQQIVLKSSKFKNLSEKNYKTKFFHNRILARISVFWRFLSSFSFPHRNGLPILNQWVEPYQFQSQYLGVPFSRGAVWRLGRKTLLSESCPKIFCYPYYRCSSPQSNYLTRWNIFEVNRCEINQ